MYITNNVWLTGTTILESAVIKYSTNSLARLALKGPLDCRTGPYHPAILTARDDVTVGASIEDSTGTPSGYYGYMGFSFWDSSTNFLIHDIQIRHLRWAFGLDPNNQLTVSHAQLGPGDTAIYGLSGTTVRHRNVVFHSYATGFGGTLTNRGEQATFHRIGTVVSSTNLQYKPELTNSLLICVTNNAVWKGEKVETNLDDNGIFQTVGGGAHYLAAGSQYRRCGWTNLAPTFLAELRTKTTYPPLIPTNWIQYDTSLYPQVPREDIPPDLGFGYDPIDYAINTVAVTNATVTLEPGVALATFGDYGFWLQDNTVLLSLGQADRPNHLTRYYAVQELTTNWGGGSVSSAVTIYPYNYGQAPPVVRLRFTQLSIPADGGAHLYVNSANPATLTTLELRHCQVYGGQIYLYEVESTPGYGWTNNLLEGVDLQAQGYPTFVLVNNLLRETSGYLFPYSDNWTFTDNLIESSTFLNSGEQLEHDYNAFYNSTNFYSNYPTNQHEKVLTNLTYQTGRLGFYYYPTNSPLIGAGSGLATNHGLYHFTTTTNQVPETNSTVDIGFHYVAVTNPTDGVPVDSDHDGLADVFEDENGNGVGSDDTYSFQNPDTNGDGLTDFQNWELSHNVLVNDQAQDEGNEKNSQSETTLLAFDQTVIVAYVDSNHGYAGYGVSNLGPCWVESPYNPTSCPPPLTVEFIGWSVSRDGGGTFSDQDRLPCSNPGTRGTREIRCWLGTVARG